MNINLRVDKPRLVQVVCNAIVSSLASQIRLTLELRALTFIVKGYWLAAISAILENVPSHLLILFYLMPRLLILDDDLHPHVFIERFQRLHPF